MSPFTLTLLVGVVATVTLFSLPSTNAKRDEKYWPTTEAPTTETTEGTTESAGGAGCRKKAKQVFCITQGNKCSKDNDCCRNLYCTQTARGPACIRHPRTDEAIEVTNSTETVVVPPALPTISP